MPHDWRLSVLAACLGLLLLAGGLVYLIVECQALPGFMGPTSGDTSPRTGLGILGLALAAAAFMLAWLFTPPREPLD